MGAAAGSGFRQLAGTAQAAKTGSRCAAVGPQRSDNQKPFDKEHFRKVPIMSARQAIPAALIAAAASAFAEEEADDLKVYVVEEVAVTGSRIKSAESLSPAPIVVMSTEEIRAQGLASIGDVLQTLVVQSNAINTQANNGGDGSTRVNLRGLGTQRTLVLVNGRRFVPGGTGADASVDLNAIPAAVIERVEVLKDGASAVYGSDAVGGVVNIITRTGMEGIEIDWFGGPPAPGTARPSISA